MFDNLEVATKPNVMRNSSFVGVVAYRTQPTTVNVPIRLLYHLQRGLLRKRSVRLLPRGLPLQRGTGGQDT